jgi:GMP synthase-like glutamine amidotransferase
MPGVNGEGLHAKMTNVEHAFCAWFLLVFEWTKSPRMKLCILDNDVLDPAAVPIWGSYAAMFERLLRGAGFEGEIDAYSARQGSYPDSFDAYDAVLLTGSRSDAFSDDAWVVELRGRVSALLAQQKKLVGVCFGHQLIAHCLGAKVGRAPQGWGLGRTHYTWHEPSHFSDGVQQVCLLASHQDQVLELPQGARLLASNAHCPIAAYAIGQQVLCIQPHPEFEPAYSAFLMNKQLVRHGEVVIQEKLAALQGGHDGPRMGRLMLRFMGQV